MFGEGDDRRRMAVSVGIGIALLAILVALIPSLELPKQVEPVVHVAVLPLKKHVQPTPTPKPPRVRAKRIAHPQLQAKVINPGQSHPAIVKKPVPYHPKILAARSSKPVWDVAPTGGQAGHGAGAGTEGNGTGGAPATEEPCGVVDFAAVPASHPDPDSGLYIYNDVQMTVHFPDGHAEQAKLDWAWHFKDPKYDFFQNADAPLVLFQFPPKAMRAQEPPIVQYVMAHTTPDGGTKMDPCPEEPPGAAPAATPH